MSNIITIEKLEELSVKEGIFVHFQYEGNIYDSNILSLILLRNNIGTSNKYYEMYVAQYRNDYFLNRNDYFLICKYGRVGNSPRTIIHKGDNQAINKKYYSLKNSKMSKGYKIYTPTDYKNEVGRLHNKSY